MNAVIAYLVARGKIDEEQSMDDFQDLLNQVNVKLAEYQASASATAHLKAEAAAAIQAMIAQLAAKLESLA